MSNHLKLIKDLKLIHMQQKIMFESNEMLQALESLINKVERENEICEDERLDTVEGVEDVCSEILTVNKYTSTQGLLFQVNGKVGQGEEPQLWFEC